MRGPFALFLSLAAACATSDPVPKDTADTPTDSDTDDGTSDGSLWNHVVTEIQVADEEDALDLDGDGDGDNALAPFGFVLDPLLADGLTTAARVTVLQVAGVDGPDDDSVALAVLTAEDADEDGTNNAGATFDAAGLDAEGTAILATPAALAGSAYAVALASEGITLGSLSFEPVSGLRLRGAVSEPSHTTTVGMAIRVAPFQELLAGAGMDELAANLTALADIDVDGDEAMDAVSVAFDLEAVPCDVE
jgi:hypothetical protein